MSTKIYYALNFKNSLNTAREQIFHEGFHDFFGFPYAEADICVSQNGKPGFIYGRHPNCFFNLSHSKSGIALCCSNTVSGIDIEDFRNFSTKLVRKISTDEEYNQFIHSKNPQAYALALWTFKESYVKYTGEGIRMSLNQLPLPKITEEILSTNRIQLTSSSLHHHSLHFTSYQFDYSRITLCTDDDSIPTMVPLKL